MPAHFPSDSATLQKNLQIAATYTTDELNKRNVYELRELIRICGIRQVQRKGVNVPIRQAKRSELVTALEIATSPYKLLASASIEVDLVDEDITKLDYESVYNLLKIAANKSTNDEIGEFARSASYEVNNWIARTYTDTPSLARFYARCNQRGQYRSRVGELVKKDGDITLTGVYGIFSDTLNALGKYDSELKAKGNKDRLTTYDANTRTINVEPLHQWALATLADTNANDWKNLVIAIAAVTGRRIYSEILSGTGRYEVAGEYEIKFTGVAKGKDINNKSHKLPTIAPAQHIVDAIQKLTDLDKRVTCANLEDFESVLACRKAADKRHSKNVGEHWKNHLCTKLLGLEQADEEASKADLTKLHGLRKLYVMHFTRGMSDREQRIKASELLCHSGDGTVASDAYTSVFKLAD